MKRRILIVDDDTAFVEAVRVVLEANGYEVTTAAGSEEELRRAREQPPDLVIVDVMMGRLTEGLEISRTLARLVECRNVPILLVTGIRDVLHLPAELVPDDTWLPVRAVLEKPIKPEKLLAEIRRVLR